MGEYIDQLRYRCADLHVAALLAAAAGDPELARECAATVQILRGAMDGTNQWAGLYRLMCWTKGEDITVNGTTFTYDKESDCWESDSKIERGLRKGQPAVRLNSVYMLRWMKGNRLIPIISEMPTKNKEEK